jgi:hypothetical protein
VHLDVSLDPIVLGLTPRLIIDGAKSGKKIVELLVGLYQLRKFLKNEPPKSTESLDGKVRIENNSGQVTIADRVVYNIYGNNNVVHQAMSRNFEALESDSAVTGYEITDNEEKPLVAIEREEFSALTVEPSHPTTNEDPSQREVVDRSTLTVFKVVFDNKYKWDFIYRGHKISARINDESFWSKVEAGDPFSKGDSLVVDLSIKQEYDGALNTFVDKSYDVVKVISHIPRERQINLDFPQEPASDK